MANTDKWIDDVKKGVIYGPTESKNYEIQVLTKESETNVGVNKAVATYHQLENLAIGACGYFGDRLFAKGYNDDVRRHFTTIEKTHKSRQERGIDAIAAAHPPPRTSRRGFLERQSEEYYKENKENTEPSI